MLETKNEVVRYLLVIIVLLVAAGVVSFFVLPTSANPLRIDPGLGEVAPGQSVSLRAYYDPDGFWGTKEQDVTLEASWFSENNSVGFISNEAGTKGLLLGQGSGAVAVRIFYKNMEATATYTVVPPPLSASCYPTVDNAKVGDVVIWDINFDGPGTPPYEYYWTGEEMKNISFREPVPHMTYRTPGKKTAEVRIIDTAHTEFTVQCQPDVTVK